MIPLPAYVSQSLNNFCKNPNGKDTPMIKVCKQVKVLCNLLPKNAHISIRQGGKGYSWECHMNLNERVHRYFRTVNGHEMAHLLEGFIASMEMIGETIKGD